MTPRVLPAPTDDTLRDELPGDALQGDELAGDLAPDDLAPDTLPEVTAEPMPARAEFTPDQIETLQKQTDLIIGLVAARGVAQLPEDEPQLRAEYLNGMRNNQIIRAGVQMTGLPEIVNRYAPLDGGAETGEPVYFRPPPIVERLPEWGRALLGVAVLGLGMAMQGQVIARQLAKREG